MESGYGRGMSTTKGFRKILVPTDFGGASDQATELALTIAEKFGAELVLLHVAALPTYVYAAYAEGLAWPTEEIEVRARVALDRQLERLRARHAATSGLVAVGDPSEKILETASGLGADLIVMGTHGRRGLGRVVLGSVAEKTVRLSPVPVLTASSRPG